jgi:hypothetical protein
MSKNIYTDMDNFNKWMATKSKVLSENNPHSDISRDNRFLAELMGWDSHYTPNSFKGRMTGKLPFVGNNRANDIATLISNVIERPDAINQLIARATQDNVYRNSAYFRGLQSAIKTAKEYGSQSTNLNDDFKARLYLSILGKCNSQSEMSDVELANFYHEVMGTNPLAYQKLLTAYNADPTGLSEWKKVVKNNTYLPHPQYTPVVDHGKYWGIASHNLITPFNLLRHIVQDSRTLKMPNNQSSLQTNSVDFGKAYFPTVINSRIHAHAAASQHEDEPDNDDDETPKHDIKKKPEVTEPAEMLDNAVQKLGHDVDAIHPDDANAKYMSIMNSLGVLYGIDSASLPKPNTNSPLGKLKEKLGPYQKTESHNSFYGMMQIIKSKTKLT